MSDCSNNVGHDSMFIQQMRMTKSQTKTQDKSTKASLEQGGRTKNLLCAEDERQPWRVCFMYSPTREMCAGKLAEFSLNREKVKKLINEKRLETATRFLLSFFAL